MTLLLEDKLAKIKDAIKLNTEVGYCLDDGDVGCVLDIVYENLKKLILKTAILTMAFLKLLLFHRKPHMF